MNVLGGIRPQVTKCQHCYKGISQLATGDWVDSDGFFYCVKTTGEITTAAARALRHTPMPVIR